MDTVDPSRVGQLILDSWLVDTVDSSNGDDVVFMNDVMLSSNMLRNVSPIVSRNYRRQCLVCRICLCCF